jgi:acetyl esterase
MTSTDPAPTAAPLDPQLAPVVAAFAENLAEPMRTYGAEETRRRLAALRRPRPAPEMAEVIDLAIPGRDRTIPARRYRPGTGTAGTLVYFHGGGWVLGSVDESDGLCRVLAQRSGCDVVSVDYRLAPEHRYPAATDDAEDAVRWVAAGLAGDRPVGVMGDSAGGNLAIAVTRRLRGSDVAIALQALVYPVTDHRMSSGSYREFAGKLMLSADDMDWFWGEYVPDPATRADPDVSPALADDLTGLPAAVVVVAGHDPMRDEALAYADALARAGVAVEVHRYDAMAHGFFTLYGAIDAAEDAINAICAAAARACGPADH